LPATVAALGASRAMITCGPTILRACNVVPRVQAALGSRYGRLCGRRSHAPVETVAEGGDGQRGAARRLHQSAAAVPMTPRRPLPLCSPRVTSTTTRFSSSRQTASRCRQRRRRSCRSSACLPPWVAPSSVAAAVG
jgi:hypothetical protein